MISQQTEGPRLEDWSKVRQYNPMKVLITGGGGFLGSHLAEKYLLLGAYVVCVDNFSTGLRQNKDHLLSLAGADKNLMFLEKDIVEPWEPWCGFLPAGFDFVFHFASPASPVHYQRLGLETMWANTLGLSRALGFADKRGARVVFASTSEVYGDPEFSPQPESYWGHVNSFGPRSCYDESKRFGEALVYTHNLKNKTRHGLVRIFNTYGPRMDPNDGRVIINFLTQAQQGGPLTIYGDGKQTRSFCFVDDLIAAIQSYANLDCTEPMNIGNDCEFSILEAAQTVQKIFSDRELKIEFQDFNIDDPKQRRPDLTMARKLLSPWSPAVSLEQGLRQMLGSLGL